MITFHSSTPYAVDPEFPYPKEPFTDIERIASAKHNEYRLIEEYNKALTAFLSHAHEFDREEDREEIIRLIGLNLRGLAKDPDLKLFIEEGKTFIAKYWYANDISPNDKNINREDARYYFDLKDGTEIDMPFELKWQHRWQQGSGDNEWYDDRMENIGETEAKDYQERQVARLKERELEDCPKCYGKGNYSYGGYGGEANYEPVCESCNGTGKVLKESGEQKEEVSDESILEGMRYCSHHPQCGCLDNCGDNVKTMKPESGASEDGKEQPIDANYTIGHILEVSFKFNDGSGYTVRPDKGGDTIIGGIAHKLMYKLIERERAYNSGSVFKFTMDDKIDFILKYSYLL